MSVMWTERCIWSWDAAALCGGGGMLERVAVHVSQAGEGGLARKCNARGSGENRWTKHHAAALLRSGPASVRRAVHDERDELVCPRVSRRTLFCHGRLESVSFDIAGTSNYVLELGVNGEQYEIMRPRNAFKALPYDLECEATRRSTPFMRWKRACGAI